MELQFKLPKDVEFILNTIENHGFEAWCVGGCVRDMLLKKTPKDYDIASSAPCEEIEKIFKNTVPTGLKHGTVTVILKHTTYEVTRYRIDGEYSDNRRPENVTFTNKFETDLSRRDFTVNAMGYHPSRGVFDPFCGRADLKAGILRTVGDPDRRFSEDALRILRAFRFASTLGFEIEKSTRASALKNAKKLNTISAERVFAETEKALGGIKPSGLGELIENGGFLNFGLKEIERAQLLDKMPKNSLLRLAALIHLCKAQSDEVCKKLKCSKKTAANTAEYQSIIENSKISYPFVLKTVNIIGFDGAEQAVAANGILHGKTSLELLKKLDKAEEENYPRNIKMLCIRGSELKAAGISGEAIGTTLERLLDVVIENPKLNTRSALFDIINETKLD